MSRVPVPRPVWVDLRKLFNAAGRPALAEQRDTFVQLDAHAEGELHEWWRGYHGEWLAVCTYSVEHIGGRVQVFHRQLVPAEVIRPRTVGAYPGEEPW